MSKLTVEYIEMSLAAESAKLSIIDASTDDVGVDLELSLDVTFERVTDYDDQEYLDVTVESYYIVTEEFDGKPFDYSSVNIQDVLHEYISNNYYELTRNLGLDDYDEPDVYCEPDDYDFY